jgi:hypothetical protein
MNGARPVGPRFLIPPVLRRISEGKDLRTGPKRTYPPWAGSANVPMIGEATSGQHIEVGVSNRPRAITPVTGTFFDEHNSYLGMQLGAVRTATFCGLKNVLSRLGKANRNPWVQGASNYALRVDDLSKKEPTKLGCHRF